jgi:hypothetical protein
MTLQPNGKKPLAIPGISSAVNRRSSRGALRHRVSKRLINRLSPETHRNPSSGRLTGYPRLETTRQRFGGRKFPEIPHIVLKPNEARYTLVTMGSAPYAK